MKDVCKDCNANIHLPDCTDGCLSFAISRITNQMRDKLTYKQECQICSIIGEWYAEWKNKMVDYKNETHSLGYAIEELKMRICRTPEEWDKIWKEEDKENETKEET